MFDLSYENLLPVQIWISNFFFSSGLLRITEWQNACFQIENKIICLYAKNLYINKLNTVQSTAFDVICN